MYKLALFLILWMGSVGETLTTGDFVFQAPAGSYIGYESIDYVEVWDSEGDYYTLYFFNILDYCITESDSPYITLSCDPTDHDTLEYFLLWVLGYYDLPEVLRYQTVDPVTYVLELSDTIGIKKLYDGMYVIGIGFTPDSGVSLTLETIAYVEPEILTSDPTPTEDGWMLSIESLDVGIIRMMKYFNGQIYIVASRALLIMDEGGHIHTILPNAITRPWDFAVAPDGLIWFVRDSHIQRVDAAGQFVDEIPCEHGGCVQIEIGADGSIYLLEVTESANDAYVRILRPSGEQTSFQVTDIWHNEDFSSRSRLGVSPQGEIYIFSDYTFNIRVFDAAGNLLTTYNQLEDIYEVDASIEPRADGDFRYDLLQQFVGDFTFTDAPYFYADHILQLMGDTVRVIDTPSNSYIMLPNGDVIWVDENIITRQPLER